MTLTTNAGQASYSIAQRGARFLLALAAGAILCATANAADVRKKSDAELNYQRERAVCMNGSSNQDRATCLKEAAAALVEARRGQLKEDPTTEKQNALARCNALPKADQADCARRVQDGIVSGSAAEGGIFRETVTTVPAAAPAAPTVPTDNPR